MPPRDQNAPPCSGPEYRAWRKFSGRTGVADTGSPVSPVVMAAIMAAVAGIMVALSVDEPMPLAKEIDPNNNPSYGVLCGMSVMGLSGVVTNGGYWLNGCASLFEGAQFL